MQRMAPAILAALAIAGCSRATPTSPEFVVPLVSTEAGIGAGQPTASTHLSGDHEIPARDTRAQGQAIFKLSEDGLTMSYKLIASNIDNVIQAHIHAGTATENGPIVVFLFGLVAAVVYLQSPLTPSRLLSAASRAVPRDSATAAMSVSTDF